MNARVLVLVLCALLFGIAWSGDGERVAGATVRVAQPAVPVHRGAILAMVPARDVRHVASLAKSRPPQIVRTAARDRNVARRTSATR
jgi:hypothetical protein